MADVGYYDTGLSGGNSKQADEIVELGQTAVNVTALTPAVLSTLRVLVIEHRGSGPVNAAVAAAMPDILAAVANGLVVVINDWSVTGSAALFPAGSGIAFTRDVESGGGRYQMNLGPDGALIANSPYGTVTNTSLDNANFSNHGYVSAASLPEGAKVLLTQDDPNHVTAFSMTSGFGAFVYTTAPVQFYGDAAAGSTGVWEDFYVNVLNYALTLGRAQPEPSSITAANDEASVNEGVATVITVLGNDSYVGKGTMKVTAVGGQTIVVGQTVTLASGSTVKLNANGTLTYTTGGTSNNANLGQSTDETFGYTISDGTISSSATIHVSIAGDYTRIDGTGKSETLNGTAFDDTINGGAGTDVLYGNAGNDILNGGGGGQIDADQMFGGIGDDTYYVDSTRDLVGENTGEGHDKVISSVTAYTLTANVEDLELATGALTGTGNDLANSIVGNSAANSINGVGGNDELDGRGGNDTLYGGAGGDSLFGGAGADTFVYKAASDSQASVARSAPAGSQSAPVLGAGANTDVIYDFTVAEGDKIDLVAIDANTRVTGNQDFVVVSQFTQVAGQMTIKTFGGLNMTAEGGAPVSGASPNGYILEGDINGDGQADFTLLFNSPTVLTVNELKTAILGISAWNITSIGTHASAPSAIQTTIPDLFH